MGLRGPYGRHSGHHKVHSPSALTEDYANPCLLLPIDGLLITEGTLARHHNAVLNKFPIDIDRRTGYYQSYDKPYDVCRD